jgi:CubicO group peptidase (beta-lactamase class C family)
VRDLLMARSGIYHPAANETSDIRQNRATRASHTAGTFWFYNNWELQRSRYDLPTGNWRGHLSSLCAAYCETIDMEDFSSRDGQYVLEGSSLHPAYPFTMSARDLARFGLLFCCFLTEVAGTLHRLWRRNGLGSLRLPSLRPIALRATATFGGLASDEWGAGAFMAPGYGGQTIAVIPSRHVVAVETVDLRQKTKGIKTRLFLDLVRKSPPPRVSPGAEFADRDPVAILKVVHRGGNTAHLK